MSRDAFPKCSLALKHKKLRSSAADIKATCQIQIIHFSFDHLDYADSMNCIFTSSLGCLDMIFSQK